MTTPITIETEAGTKPGGVNMEAKKEIWKRQHPTEDGWWRFWEDGMGFEQRILVVGGHVASDDEWERATGQPPKESMCENYWEGNPVDQMTYGPLTTGSWCK